MATTHKTVIILAYALLEWILIIMLLFNSIFSYLIRKFATYYTLKPPCVWCSTIDHLFDPNNNVSPYQNLFCEAHATEFLNLYYSPDRQKLSVDRLFNSGSEIKSSFEGKGMVEFMDLHVENKSPCIQVFDQIIPLEWTDSSTSCSRTSSLNGDENQEARFLPSSCLDKEDKVVTIDSLTAELKAERLVVCRLYIELDEERKASAVAANQAMAMITKLQEQKVALQIEYIQNQRMMNEQAEYDQEVLELLNELVMKLEKDKFELENELEMHKAKMMHSSCVLDSKNLRGHEESVVEFEIERLWILDKLKDLDVALGTLTNDLSDDHVRKASLEGEDLDYKGNKLLPGFNVKSIVEEAEASRSPWTRSMF
ncbi:hypothetical protein L1987_33932 [Smallanthus sonchifolius]|uniref:Uncharacterized protein n=1 Tax=Smallanthus sonchifolius TaxID=185202 RepID=A0ACB9HRW3_9ASTR|nr:hypothetical protein L1987_33932 [Smallanthus sonchifolius]